MATQWLQESRTGKYYMTYTYPDGQTVRRYEDELHQEQSQSSYNPEPQEYLESRSGLYPVDQREVDTRTSTSSSRRHTRETPRSESQHVPSASTRGTRRQCFVQSTPRPQLAPHRSSRREGKEYHDSKGYNPSYEQRAGVRTGYDVPDPNPRLLASSSYQDPIRTDPGEAVYDDVSASSAIDIATGMDQMTMEPSDFSSSPNYEFSPSQKPTFSSPAPLMPTSSSSSNQWSTKIAQNPPYTTNIHQSSLGMSSPVAEENPFPGRRINSTPGETEPLDPSFRVRNTDWQTFFSCGRVFKTLWTDPYNPIDASEHGQFPTQVSLVAYGERVHSKVRRFVVVKRKNNSCQCLPITTYGGRYFKKKGITIQDHGLIYTEEPPPRNDRGIDKDPLKLKPPKKGGEKLTRTSYINYGRSYSIDCYVKVKDLGELDKESRSLLRNYFFATMIGDDDYSGPGTGLISESQSTELIGIGTGVGSYRTSQSTYPSSEANRRPSISQRQSSQYQVNYQAGPSTHVEDSAATGYSDEQEHVYEETSYQDAAQSEYEPQFDPYNDDRHDTSQSTHHNTLNPGDGQVSYEDDPTEQPHDVYESETAAGPSGSLGNYPSAEPRQALPEPIAANREGEEGNDLLEDVQSRQPQRHRRRRRHRDPK